MGSGVGSGSAVGCGVATGVGSGVATVGGVVVFVGVTVAVGVLVGVLVGAGVAVFVAEAAGLPVGVTLGVAVTVTVTVSGDRRLGLGVGVLGSGRVVVCTGVAVTRTGAFVGAGSTAAGSAGALLLKVTTPFEVSVRVTAGVVGAQPNRRLTRIKLPTPGLTSQIVPRGGTLVCGSFYILFTLRTSLSLLQ